MEFGETQLNSVRFIWDIHYRCNYRCPYCWFYNSWQALSSASIYPPIEEWIRAWDRIYDLYGESYIEITGGEPFLYPNFCELLKEISARHKIRVTTNLSANKDVITNLVNSLDNRKVNFEISFHPLFVSIDNFLEKAAILKEKGFCNCLQFVAYPPQIKMIPYLESQAEQQGLGFSVTAFWGAYNNKMYPGDYSSDDKEMLKAYVKDINRIKLNVEGISTRGKLCYAGNRFALIKGNGDVVRCGQSKSDEVIGNFLGGDFLLSKNPLPCHYDHCPCNDYSPAPSDVSTQEQDKNAQGRDAVLLRSDVGGCAENADFSDQSGSDRNLRQLQAREPGLIGFSWEICYTCNYRCPYCHRWNDVSGDDLYLGPSEWERIWRTIYDRYGSCNMFISGAEPATYPYFFDIVQRVSEMHTITVCTNFSWNAEEVLGRNIDPQRVQVTPTYHSLFADFDSFLSKAVKLKQWIKDNLVFFVAYPPQMQKVGYYKKKMNKNGLNFCIVPLRANVDGHLSVVTSEEDKNSIGSITDMQEDEFIYLAKNSSPKGKLCHAGYRYALIKATGKVFPCSQNDLCLGCIQDDGFVLLEKPIVCSFDFCPYESYNLLERHKVPHVS